MNENLDIVSLIEKNPITRLSNNYQNDFINKIKQNFTEDEQQLFVANFYCYLNYNKNEFIIGLDEIWKWLGYNRIDAAKAALKNNFIINIHYKIVFPNVQENSKNGRPKEIIKMTIKTFKKFCLRSGTIKANGIREYYIKMEDLFNESFETQFNELQLQFEQKDKQLNIIDNENKKLIKQRQNDKQTERQDILLKQFNRQCNIVYIIKVKTFNNGCYVIKIGESRNGINERFSEHKRKYDECLLLDCFEVRQSKQFEHFLHKELCINKVKNLEGHEKENELLLVGKNLTYEFLLKLINKNIDNYNDNYSLLIELEQSKIDKQTLETLSSLNDKSEFLEFCKIITENQRCIMNEFVEIKKFNEEILNRLDNLSITTYNNFSSNVGGRLQEINPETFELIKVYETIEECTKKNPTYNRTLINKAVKNDTIYQGFRWALVDRELNPNIIHDIQPTIDSKQYNTGYIAKLNSDKTEIFNVYLNKSIASLSNGYSSANVLDIVVKDKKLYKGYYYMYFSDCNEKVKKDFIYNHGGVILYKNGIGKYNEEDNLIQEFIHRENCCKISGLNFKTLNKAITNKTVYKEFYYRELPEKLQIVKDEFDNNETKTIEDNNENLKEDNYENIITQYDNTDKYIAKLDNNMTKILNVYVDSNTASIINDYTTINSLNKSIKDKTLSNNNYYLKYDDCDELLKNNFVKEYGIPILNKTVLIGQYDSDEKLVRKFLSKIDCWSTMKITAKTLVKRIKDGNSYNGFYYKEISEKLQMVDE